MLSINTNLSSLITQRSMKQSTNLLNQAIERMTTGAKINHAKDNAANYSIATNMTTQIGALQVAEDNAAMGLDMLATANGTLDQIHDKLQRLRDLAVQASNGTYGEDSLRAINSEANALVDEIERLYNTTEYNGINLMKGQVVSTEESKFIKDIDRRDTSKMTTLASVDETVALDSGTYSISTPEELAKLATMTNNGLIGASCEFVLGADIDLSGYSNWTPIGDDIKFVDGSRDFDVVFQASFDGNGYVIKNLTVNTTENFNGLFGYATNCTISNLGIEESEITGGNIYNGLLVGDVQYSIISNCYAEGDISGCNNYVGGLVGYSVNTEIVDCYTEGNFNVSTSSYVGGLVGYICWNTKIDNCFSSVNIDAKNFVGGLVGSSYNGSSFIYNSYSRGSINGRTFVGSLLGCVCNSASENATIKIENCYTTSPVTCSAGTTGLIGELRSSILTNVIIEDCYYNTDDIVQNIRASNVGDVVFNNLNKIDTNTMLFEIDNKAKCNNYTGTIGLQVGINTEASSRIDCHVDSNYLSKLSLLRYIGKVLPSSTKAHISYSNAIDGMIQSLSTKQISYGATENRLNSALEEISTKYENLVSSRSTIQDADIAEVSSEYIRQQILQQASATLMSTANQSASIALSLI